MACMHMYMHMYGHVVDDLFQPGGRPVVLVRRRHAVVGAGRVEHRVLDHVIGREAHQEEALAAEAGRQVLGFGSVAHCRAGLATGLAGLLEGCSPTGAGPANCSDREAGAGAGVPLLGLDAAAAQSDQVPPEVQVLREALKA